MQILKIDKYFSNIVPFISIWFTETHDFQISFAAMKLLVRLLWVFKHQSSNFGSNKVIFTFIFTAIFKWFLWNNRQKIFKGLFGWCNKYFFFCFRIIPIFDSLLFQILQKLNRYLYLFRLENCLHFWNHYHEPLYSLIHITCNSFCFSRALIFKHKRMTLGQMRRAKKYWQESERVVGDANKTVL